MKEFAGKIAVVTGGGTGMGRELARQLVAEGCNVAMCDISEAAMAETRRLPRLRQGDWDWQVRAACRGIDTSHFYHPENERGPSRVRREMRAKAVCCASLVRS